MSVTPAMSTLQSGASLRRALGAASTVADSSLLTVWLLLEPAYLIQASYALAVVNLPATQVALAAAIASELAGYTSAPLTASTSIATPVTLLQSVSGNVPASPDGPSGPSFSVAGLVVGLILGWPLSFCLFVVCYTRFTGGTPPCCLRSCTGPIVVATTCCGKCPLRKRRPTSSEPAGRKAKSWRTAIRVEMRRPVQQWGGSGSDAVSKPSSLPHSSSATPPEAVKLAVR